jgi:hypothetical protein
MAPANRIDAASLVKEASASEQKESYRLIEKTQSYRIGIGVRLSPRPPSFFLEIIIYHLPVNENPSRSNSQQQRPLFKRLRQRGYVVSCQEETNTALERILPQDSLATEVHFLKSLVK